MLISIFELTLTWLGLSMQTVAVGASAYQFLQITVLYGHLEKSELTHM
jgi:hypothetical protein